MALHDMTVGHLSVKFCVVQVTNFCHSRAMWHQHGGTLAVEWLQVASMVLMAVWGLGLSVYLGYITKGCAGGAVSPRARCASFHTHIWFGGLFFSLPRVEGPNQGI
jgi:hypothetical protein